MIVGNQGWVFYGGSGTEVELATHIVRNLVSRNSISLNKAIAIIQLFLLRILVSII